MGYGINDIGKRLAYVGTRLKLAVVITCEGFSMDDDEWEVMVTRDTKSVVITKEEAFLGNDGRWYVLVDTDALGVGMAWITSTAYVPDDDMEGGVRVAVLRRPLIRIAPVIDEIRRTASGVAEEENLGVESAGGISVEVSVVSTPSIGKNVVFVEVPEGLLITADHEKLRVAADTDN